MPLPRTLARFNRVVTNRLFAPLAGRIPPWVLVEHVGRRSGRHYQAVLMAFPRGHDLVLALTYGESADWVRNVTMAQWCRVKYAHRWHEFSSAELVRGDAALGLLPPVLRPLLAAAGMRTVLHLRPSNRIG
ncbi:MAG: nitroreductase family deazaflavin-dependent oxidoreductase [Chloroflexi bacterium]|nr:nitroreductase family deazaflavin-dependent oxidoreductase [Chloroflexota bacterium]MBV9544681.1 nitroreductase family deazaflavin-dependent oxidoreductase [Chloroflexota bacterium]